MALTAAPGGRRNQVRIQPPFWNEDLGRGSCVAQATTTTLRLETCAAGKAAQIWTVLRAGDWGQIQLSGRYRVDGRPADEQVLG